MLNGSWNQDGSTKAGLDEMAKVFAAEGVETEVVTIGGKPIADCIACGKCAELKHCVFENDGVNDFAAKAKDAASVVKQLIQKVGNGKNPYRIADGSGLSLYNYVTPELEMRLLRYAYRNSNIYLHLLPSLPVAGRDGTLKTRMKGTFAEENVKAKTGTVTGISALAGYCTAANGHQLCFSIINQGIMKSDPGRNFQDRVCNALCAP